MNKRIFLTSMAVMIGACAWSGSAFAAPTTYGVEHGDGYITSENEDPVPCEDTPLTYTDDNGTTHTGTGTFTLTAQWKPQHCRIRLDPNGGVDVSSPDRLYTTYDVGAYHDIALVRLMSPTAFPLDYEPGAPEVTLSYDLNVPSGNTVSPVSPYTASKTFAGFFLGANDLIHGGSPMIKETLYITPEGTEKAASYYDDDEDGVCEETWFANWKCPTMPTPMPTPTLAGYTFRGWFSTAGRLNAGGGLQYYGGEELCNDRTIYAGWHAEKYSVTYNCNDGTWIGGGLNIIGHTGYIDSVTYDTDYTFRSMTSSCSRDGFTAQGWDCRVTGSSTLFNPWFTSKTWNNSVGSSYGVDGVVTYDVTCTAQWDGLINLVWDTDGGESAGDGSNSCDYQNGNFLVPSTPTRPGYTFTGWQVTDWDDGHSVNGEEGRIP